MKLGTESLSNRTRKWVSQHFAPHGRDVILAIGPEAEDFRAISELVAPGHCTLQRSQDRRHARLLLDRHPVAVVVTERDLPDGTWRNIHEDLWQCEEPPRLVVASRYADERTSSHRRLDSGGFDVPDEARAPR